MTDLPDWTGQQQAGGIRYLGSVSVTIGGGGSGGGSLNVTLLPLDRSIIVVCPGRGAITSTTVDVLTNDPAVSPALFSTSAGVSADPQPVNAYVSPAITSLWQVAVDMTGPPAGPYVFYVFVDSSVTHVAVDPGAASIPVGITSPATGQGTMLGSLPVVIASDQSAVRVVTNGQGTSLASGASSQAPQANTFGAGQIPAGSRIYAAFGHFVNRTSGTIAEMEVALVDGLGGHHYFGWSFAVGTGVGPAVNVVYPIGIIPAGLSLSGTWVVAVTTSAHSGSPLLDWNAGVVWGA